MDSQISALVISAVTIEAVADVVSDTLSAVSIFSVVVSVVALPHPHRNTVKHSTIISALIFLMKGVLRNSLMLVHDYYTTDYPKKQVRN